VALPRQRARARSQKRRRAEKPCDLPVSSGVTRRTVLTPVRGTARATPAAAGGSEQVAWAAHVGGFLYGLSAIRLFAPRRGFS